ncbi:sigma-E factor negative regulatory protein [Luteimonas sp. A277]
MMQHEDSDSIQILPDADKLDRYHRQQLSAMLDGELSPDQARFMLRRLQHDVELAERWERWQISGDVLRGQRNALLPTDFASRVSMAITEQESQPVPQRARGGGQRVLRWGGGAALAASVAMAALLVGRQGGPMTEQAPVRAVPALAATAGASPGPAVSAPSESEIQSAPVIDGVASPTGPVLAEAPHSSAGSPDAQRQVQPAVASRSSAGTASVRSSQMLAAADAAPAAAAASVETPTSREAVVVPFPATQGSAVALLPSSSEGIDTDPFHSLPMTVGSRPWPRAGVSGAGNAYAVGLGQTMQPAATWLMAAPPEPQAAAERFGLPPEVAARMVGRRVETAIGAGAVRGAQAPAVPASAQQIDPDIGPR